jgi:exodeoxyribonuclease VII large subunit
VNGRGAAAAAEATDGGPRPESVTAFTRRVKQLLEDTLGSVWIRGEISNLRAQASGHTYFSLKDAGAQLSAVLFRGDAARQTVRLRDGLQVIVQGDVSVYEARGQHQLIVRVVVDDGVGRLQREFEALKARLAAEGLFDRERKRPLPALPRTVGFITSPTGAAVQDFLRILQRRGWRGRVVILPARVQGEGAAAELAAQLALAAEVGGFDLLVIGRGGGSLEDLWAFNEEPLVRAVAASPIPVLSAVGHEIDFTLCDFAADHRAETPSAAAELLTSGFVAALERARHAGDRLGERVDAALERHGTTLDHARARLRLLSPAARVEQAWQRADDLRGRLGAALRHLAQERRQALAEARGRLLRASPEPRIELASHQLLSLWKRLQAASPASVLNRGFVILRDPAGRPVTRRASLPAGAPLEAEFADGRLRVRAETGN